MKKLSFFLSFILLSLNFLFGQQTEKIKIYNEEANPEADISLAVKKASTEKKHVLIQIGGNWCAWCVMFDRLTKENQEIKNFLDKNYETVHINYSPKNKNEKILTTLKHPERFGFPVFVILDEKGNMIHTQNSAYLESKNEKGHDPKVVLEFLKNWSYEALDPSSYLKDSSKP